MHVIRVPYPTDPDHRRAAFERALAKLGRFGTFQGSTEAGTFRGSTPIGRFSGHYRSPDGSGVLEIELAEKPWLISLSFIEGEVRRFLNTA